MEEVILIAALFASALYLLPFAEPGEMKRRIGVIAVDIQGDFTVARNGALAVEGTDQSFIEAVEKATSRLSEKGYLIFATQDWHPPDHISFYTNHPGRKAFEVMQIHGRTQVLWPPHCVQGTAGAAFHPQLQLPPETILIRKGTATDSDDYSAFHGCTAEGLTLAEALRARNVRCLLNPAPGQPTPGPRTLAWAQETRSGFRRYKTACKGYQPA